MVHLSHLPQQTRGSTSEPAGAAFLYPDGRKHPFSSWHWTSGLPLSLPKLQNVLEGLPETVYRAKGTVHLEELPQYQISFQMVGRRYNLKDTDPWGPTAPRSEIVLIACEDGIDRNDLQHAFDGCIGTGDESQSPILRLSRRLVE